MKQYLCHIDEHEISPDLVAVVEAETEEQAKEKYILKHYYPKNKDMILEYGIYDPAINGSGLAEKCWEGNKGIVIATSDEDAERKYQQLEKLREKEDKEELQRRFESNVREFFEEHQEYADLYLRWYYSDDASVVFPEEMIQFYALKDNLDRVVVKELVVIR